MTRVIWTRKEDREREKTLQKKLGDLTTQIQRLERRISLLRTENETLQRLSSTLPGVDETSVASTTSNATTSATTPTPDSDHMRRMVARQRARDLAEHAKAMLAKDREIEELRRKCQDLADQLSNGEISAPQNAVQFEEKEELVNIIKQAAKERLQLEQQLGHSRGREKVLQCIFLFNLFSPYYVSTVDAGVSISDLKSRRMFESRLRHRGRWGHQASHSKDTSGTLSHAMKSFSLSVCDSRTTLVPHRRPGLTEGPKA
ncbi:peripheral-type benzodiazepine receptor-associated protein 1 [Plakobranchus ocellatus]|uniref:Peripheral-type benzodiazepine receptor-associated protein 1 n=1 Tax=Plakobranchus ocellatus TaxID=259542 RepID=A0AAV3Y1M8_9GAST|nr:peripheral-type benzodiazepine receptor-associated protein 1 [Plakobranchus ocellatus]